MPPEHEVAGSNPAGRMYFQIVLNDPMSEETPSDKNQRFPRLALFTVAFGLLVSAAVLALAHLPGGSTKDAEWDTLEAVKTPKAVKLGNGGSLGLARTTISALAPNISNESIFMIAGVANIDSGGNVPTTIQCDVAGDGEAILDEGELVEETTIARTPKLRAAWPRPSGEEDLNRQEVPELLVTKFHSLGADVLNLPIRTYFRRYTDTASPITVDWDTDENGTRQSWIWEMPEGTGGSAATLAYAVIFKTVIQPSGTIKCSATAGKSKAVTKAPFKQKEWPIVVSEDDAAA